MKLGDRLYLWGQYRDLLSVFIRIVDDDMSYKFCPSAPLGVDEDTPCAQELFEKLCDTSCFIDGHIRELERKEKLQNDIQES